MLEHTGSKNTMQCIKRPYTYRNCWQYLDHKTKIKHENTQLHYLSDIYLTHSSL